MGEIKRKKNGLRQPGIEPGSAAWKATMLTITPLTLYNFKYPLLERVYTQSYSHVYIIIIY